ncbi:MAG TPA: ABC transporter substrate-binding protein [Casimicrobiaceae bacterium]|jgi:sulfonate transport system substrate-binding protein|nr:ABC transporter substrate-binding protein [Casimicrobiaceae bacterium]
MSLSPWNHVWMLLLALASVDARAAGNELRVAEQYGFSYLQLTYMQKHHLIEDQAKAAGLPDVKVTWSQFAAGNVMNDALLSGSLDIASGGVAPPIVLWDKTREGLDVRMIAAMVSAPLYLNTTNPAIKSLRDFTARDKIALPAVKVSNQATILAMAAAAQLGKDKAESLNALTVSMSHPDGMTALLNGSVTAHFTAPPFQDWELKDPRVHRVLNSFDVMGGPLTFTVLWTTSKFRNENPILYRAFVAALKQATDMINADKRAAAQLYVESTKSKEPVDEVYALISDPAVEFTMTPRQIFKYATFMHENGQIRHAPSSWKDMFFEDVYALPGS